ncbi:MAG TPA: hypothetical protein P5155_00575 [Candidatus Absconditabacterales bacterium]|nr:hypothetical protein [Candidatus Absconditabacterales bacterium]
MERKKTCLNIIIILLGIILILNILTLFKKDARTIETLKVGGADNMKKVEQLYNSDEYISQQTMAIDQALSQMNMLGNLSEEELYEMMAGEEVALEGDVEEDIIDIELE